MPIAAQVELDHFPVPESEGGTATVPACVNCHTLKDRGQLIWQAAAADAALAAMWSPRPGALPAVAYIEMWGQWVDQPHALPPYWGQLAPLERIMFARLLADRLRVGRDRFSEALQLAHEQGAA